MATYPVFNKLFNVQNSQSDLGMALEEEVAQQISSKSSCYFRNILSKYQSVGQTEAMTSWWCKMASRGIIRIIRINLTLVP